MYTDQLQGAAASQHAHRLRSLQRRAALSTSLQVGPRLLGLR